jgi:hypothetical protein
LGPAEVYKDLLESRLSEDCNDTSLVLRKMFELEGKEWRVYFDKQNRDALCQTVTNTLKFTRASRASQKWLDDQPLIIAILSGIASVDACLSRASDGVVELDLWKASMAFLKMAVDLEEILWEMQHADKNEEDPIKGFADMKL